VSTSPGRGEEELYSADIVVVACGALSSALLLLRSGNDKHPKGLANGSGQVGRNYMRHNQSILMALMRKPTILCFKKTLAVSDYYFSSDDWDFPLGLISDVCDLTRCPNSWRSASGLARMGTKNAVRGNGATLDGFWLSSEDLPRPENRIYYDGERVVLDLTEGNMEAHHRLKKKLEKMLSNAGSPPVLLLERSLYLGQNVPIGGTAHQAGPRGSERTRRRQCLTSIAKHMTRNLYVTDASFFPSIGSVNPTLNHHCKRLAGCR